MVVRRRDMVAPSMGIGSSISLQRAHLLRVMPLILAVKVTVSALRRLRSSIGLPVSLYTRLGHSLRSAQQEM